MERGGGKKRPAVQSTSKHNGSKRCRSKEKRKQAQTMRPEAKKTAPGPEGK